MLVHLRHYQPQHPIAHTPKSTLPTMDTAARAPTNQSECIHHRYTTRINDFKTASFDKMHNAAVNERDPTSTSNMGVTGPPTTSTVSTTTTTTKTTGGPTDNAPGYLQQARETLASFADSVQQAVGIGMLVS